MKTKSIKPFLPLRYFSTLPFKKTHYSRAILTLLCKNLTPKTVPAAKRKTESNNLEKTLNAGKVSNKVVVDSVGDDGSEIRDVRR